MKIKGLYSGSLSHIGDKQQPTGIYKQSVNAVSVNELGVIGDVQADKRFHGGPEKALHQMALFSYEKIIKRYPLLHNKMQAGSLGENISATGMHEHNVFIGDIYQVGSAKLQVSSPRIPCWKIDAKFCQPNLNQFISLNRLNGWYYRVLQPGHIAVNDEFDLVQRSPSAISIDSILQVIHGQADTQLALQTIHAVGLDPEWKKRLQNKYD